MRSVIRNLAYRIPGVLEWRLSRTLRLRAWRFAAMGQDYELLVPEAWVHALLNDDGTGKLTGVDRDRRYEAAFCDKFISLLDRSTVLLDVGAAHGLYSVIAARTCDPRNIHCFEPDPVSRWILARNNREHCDGRLRITPYRVGAAPAKGTVTLDRYCRDQAVKPTLVKMDIEGGEIDALVGMRRICTEHRPIIIMEYHLRKLLRDWKADPADILRMLREYGYRVRFNGHHWHLVVNQGVRDSTWTDRLPNDVNCALLAEPEA